MSRLLNRSRWTGVAAMGVAAGLTLTACGSGGGAAGGSASGKCDLPATIGLVGVRDQTGPISYTGKNSAEGSKLAVQQINEQDYLGKDVKLEVTEADTAFDPQNAAQEVTAAVAKSEVRAILGPLVSNQALAAAPIAQQAGMPIVFTQAGVSGLLTGDKTFRATAPQETIFHLATDHIRAEKMKSVSVILLSSNPTYKEVGSKILPDLLEGSGVDILSTTDAEASVTDFRGPASRIAKENPDAVVLLLLGSQAATAVTQLRQSGFDGQIYTNSGITDQLAGAGEAANGVIYPTDFSYAMTDKTSAAFSKAYEAEFGKKPDPLAAEAFDQTWWVARGIKEAGCADRAAIAQGMKRVAEQGFDGAMGDLKFKDGNDLRVEGVLVQFDGKTEKLVDPES